MSDVGLQHKNPEDTSPNRTQRFGYIDCVHR